MPGEREEAEMKRAEKVQALIRELILSTDEKAVLPRELAMAVESHGWDWGFWHDTPVVTDLVTLEFREAYTGYWTPHYVLKPEGGDES